MGTIMVRDVPDEQIDIVKEAAKAHNRSMEAEMRSNVARWTAAWVAHKETNSTDFSEELQTYLLFQQPRIKDNDVSHTAKRKNESVTQKESTKKPATTAEIFAKAHRLLRDSGLTGDEQLIPPRSGEIRHVELGN
ncbi:hypothetical protein OZX72_07935 [Bifidobacterium sp. ESL0769]|uniref:FitA-like ribbon-helix-helix domain-containing protein n=1 Tax=Bifidobacterium sp. ESL0769 TaxID=2983229 RepID=UPI0023F8CD88|nr:hypothetical protein [Bifidobacterium sp. ESL0769]WEV67157.1 hypothetical protein OZX72_07935 [Bifidobacterium sp. ESL0769]